MMRHDCVDKFKYDFPSYKENTNPEQLGIIHILSPQATFFSLEKTKESILHEVFLRYFLFFHLSFKLPSLRLDPYFFGGCS